MTQTRIDIETASKRSGLSPQHVAHLCREVFEPRGLARMVICGNAKRRADNAKCKWLIDETADPRFHRVKLPDEMPADLRHVRECDRDIARRREAVILRLRSFRAAMLEQKFTVRQATDAFIESEKKRDPDLKLSRATVYNWEKGYNLRGVEALVPAWAETAQPEIDEAAANLFDRYYLRPAKHSIRMCFEMVAHEAKQHGWSWFTNVRSCQRWVKTRYDQPKLVLNRHGEKVYNAVCAPYIERDPEQFAGNECWVGDHHQFDFWCDDHGRLIRPWLTAWQDMRSRVVAGHTIAASPNQTTILTAFRRGAVEHGLPWRAYIDNGKDYRAAMFHGGKAVNKKVLDKGYLDESLVRGVFGQLGIATTFAIPYNPQSKPIERTFRTFADQFSKTFATYCGNCPQNRPEDIQAILADRSNIPTLDQVREAFGRYLAEVYHVAPHSGAGMDNQSPLAVLRKTQAEKRVGDERAMDLLLTVWAKPVTVGKGGAVRVNNVLYGMADPTLMQYIGHRVYVSYDPADVSRVLVWDTDLRFIAEARNRRLGQGTDETHLREAMATKRRIRKHLKQADAVRGLKTRDVTDLAIAARARAAADRAGELPAADDPVLRPVRTDMDDQIDAAMLRESERMRKAVGDDLDLDAAFDRAYADQDAGDADGDVDIELDGSLLRLARDPESGDG